MSDDGYKREEDRKWRAKVDHEQVTLMTGHQVLSERLKRLERLINELDRAMRGDPTNERNGISARLHEQETLIARLNAVVFMDSTGRRGLLKEVETLRSGETRSETRWKAWTAIAVAAISSCLLTLDKWPEILKFLKSQHMPSSKTNSTIHSRRIGSRHKKHPVDVEPVPYAPQDDVPE